MKIRTFLLLSVIFAAGFTSLEAQQRVIEKSKVYHIARITLPGKVRIAAKDLSLINDTLLQFKSRNSNGSMSMKELSTSEIRYLKIKTGNNAAIGFAAGASLGLVFSVTGALYMKNNPAIYESHSNWTSFIAGFTAGGAILGTFIGLCIPELRKYTIPDPNTPYSLKVSSSVFPGYKGLGLRLKF